MGMIKTTLDLKRSKEGQLLEKRSQPSRSWVKHFFDLMYCPVSRLQAGTINDTGGAARLLDAIASGSPLSHLNIGAPAGGIGCTFYEKWNSSGVDVDVKINGDQWGLVVGTDNTAVTPAQDALIAKIAHGGAAGQLLYGGTELYGLAFADPNGEFKIRRYFTNLLGGDIAVQEVGIYSPAILVVSGDNFIFMIARDVIAAGGITVSNGEILEATYTVQITV